MASNATMATIAGIRAALASASEKLETLARDTEGSRPHDQVQVDVGTYEIRDGDLSGRLIAEVYVTVDPGDPSNEKIRIEHWGLYPSSGWVTPSSRNQTPHPLAFMYVTGGYASETDFKRAIATTAGAIYIVARCEVMPL